MKEKTHITPLWFHGLLTLLCGIGLLTGVMSRTSGLDMPFFPMMFTVMFSVLFITASYYIIKACIMSRFKPEDYDMPKGRFSLANTLLTLSAYSAVCVALVSLFSSFAHEYESRYDRYPYHNAETSKGQYEYGGSTEQQKQLRDADFYLTEEEYANKDEYEEQVNRELGYY